jgi:hypothetical protein
MISCRGAIVVADTKETEFGSADSARSYYDSFLSTARDRCRFEFVEAEDFAYGDMGQPPDLSENTVFSTRLTQIAGAGCVNEVSNQSFVLMRSDSIDDRQGRTKTWSFIEGFHLNSELDSGPNE